MTNVLDTIDRAVSDWETSADAMRWTPEPPKQPIPLVYLPSVDEVVIAARTAEAFAQVRIQMSAVAEKFAEAMKGIAAALAPLLKQPSARPERVAHLRRSYRSKRRHW
ncbi:hypothetical protein AB0C44_07935 [Micromonospora taraxaci]|uniref:hypothetical protein n=1 Tax=Micromonospora taraxaci TaxID=1316803 RepID=UPI0033D2349C